MNHDGLTTDIAQGKKMMPQVASRNLRGLRGERYLWLIIAAAAALRLGAAVAMGDRVEVLPGIYDQVSYDAVARQLLAGRGFTVPADWWPLTRAGEPTAHWSYLYTLYLAAVYALFGPHPLAARVIQAIIAGVLGPLLIYRIGRRLFGGTVGLAGAALMAVYIYFIYYSAALITETFYILAVLWALDLALELAESPRPRYWVLLGLALGLAVLLRQLILLFIPFLLLWLMWAGRGRVRRRYMVVPLLIMAVLILPCTVRNYQAFDQFVLLNTNAGFAFFWANHPIYGTNFTSLLPAGGPSYPDLVPAELRGLDEAALDQALLRRGIGFVLEDPGRYALLSFSRIKDYFKFWPSPESSLTSNVSRVLSFGLYLPFMTYGLVLSFRDWRRCSLLYLFVGVYTLIHLLSWAMIRYRLPVDAVLIVFAGLAVTDLVHRVFGPRRATTKPQIDTDEQRLDFGFRIANLPIPEPTVRTTSVSHPRPIENISVYLRSSAVSQVCICVYLCPICGSMNPQSEITNSLHLLYNSENNCAGGSGGA